MTAALYGREPALATAVAAFVGFEHRQGHSREPARLADPDHLRGDGAGRRPARGDAAAAGSGARQREREALALFEVARLVPGSTLELQPLLGLILDQLKSIVEYQAAEIILHDEHDEPVVFAYRGPLRTSRWWVGACQPGAP